MRCEVAAIKRRWPAALELATGICSDMRLVMRAQRSFAYGKRSEHSSGSGTA